MTQPIRKLMAVVLLCGALSALADDVAAAKKAEPNAVATERAAQLERDLANVVFELRYFGEQDKPYYKLLLGGPAVQLPNRADGSALVAQLTAEQMRKVVAHLAGESFLARAIDTRFKDMKIPDGPCYVMMVRCQGVELWQELPWNRSMLQQFDALRGVLDGEAGKAMDLLIGRLSGHRREWEQKGKK